MVGVSPGYGIADEITSNLLRRVRRTWSWWSRSTSDAHNSGFGSRAVRRSTPAQPLVFHLPKGAGAASQKPMRRDRWRRAAPGVFPGRAFGVLVLELPELLACRW